MRLCLQCSNTCADNNWQCKNCGHTPDIQGGFPVFAPAFSADAGFKDSFFAELYELEAKNFWFKARNKLILWALKKYFPAMRSFLEIGCGTGFVLSSVANAFPELRISGSEISSAGLVYAASRVPQAELFQMDARAIPFVDEFDVIGAFDVLEHIEEDEAVISEMISAVRPGGGILLTVPQHEFLWSRMDEHACHVRRYAAHDLLAKVNRAGCKVERITSFVSLLLPAMAMSRSIQRSDVDDYDGLAELKIGKAVNFLFGKIMDMERLAIRAGISFPGGGSLLIVARKVI